METCGHCKIFNLECDKFFTQYNGELILNKIKVNEANDLLKKYSIDGFPTILLIDEHDNTKTFVDKRTVAV